MRAAEHKHDLPCQRKANRPDHNTDENKQRKRRVENAVRLCGFSLSHFNTGARRAAEPDEICKRLDDQRNGQHNAERSKRIHADGFNFRDVHAIHNII